MKVTIEFEDQEEAMTAMQGSDWKQVAWRLDETLRNQIKYSEKDEIELQSIRDILHAILADYKLNLE